MNQPNGSHIFHVSLVTPRSVSPSARSCSVSLTKPRILVGKSTVWRVLAWKTRYLRRYLRVSRAEVTVNGRSSLMITKRAELARQTCYTGRSHVAQSWCSYLLPHGKANTDLTVHALRTAARNGPSIPLQSSRRGHPEYSTTSLCPRACPGRRPNVGIGTRKHFP